MLKRGGDLYLISVNSVEKRGDRYPLSTILFSLIPYNNARLQGVLTLSEGVLRVGRGTKGGTLGGRVGYVS